MTRRHQTLGHGKWLGQSADISLILGEFRGKRNKDDDELIINYKTQLSQDNDILYLEGLLYCHYCLHYIVTPVKYFQVDTQAKSSALSANNQ